MPSDPTVPPPGPSQPGGGTPGHGYGTPGHGVQPQGYGYGSPRPWYGPIPISPVDERTWATLAHVGGLLVPFAWLIIYLVYRDRSAFVRRHAAEATNFHLSMMIYQFAMLIVGLVLAVATLGLGLLALIPALLGLALLNLVATIMGAMAANRGAEFRYPLTIRMVD